MGGWLYYNNLGWPYVSCYIFCPLLSLSLSAATARVDDIGANAFGARPPILPYQPITPVHASHPHLEP